MAAKKAGGKKFSANQWGMGANRPAVDNPAPADPNAKRVSCTVSGVKPRFVSADESFAIWPAVMEIEEKGKKKEVSITIQGALARVNSGEMLDCEGKWNKHPKHGWSFKVDKYESALPQNETGIAAWLEARVDGVGPTFAKAIVAHFGADQVFKILDADPTKLREVRTEKGRALPAKQVDKAIEAWDEAKAIRQIETFLFSHGITAKRADQLYRHYGEEVIKIMQTTPYRITELRGIGFRIADKIAQNMGVDVEDPDRIEAAIVFVLDEAESQGHVFLSLDQLLGATGMALQMEDTKQTASPRSIVDGASRLAEKGKIKFEDDEHLQQRVYSRRWWETERRVARIVRELLGTGSGHRLFPPPKRPQAPEGATAEEIEALMLPTDEQWSLMDSAREHRLSLLIGGPGVGKTASMTWLMDIAEKEGLKVHLAAPTGKAARRMQELTGHPAGTIHRLLEFSPFEGGFQRNESNPLVGDLLVIDESSMLSLDLADSLLRAIPDNMHVLFVGDNDQLPPVGAGKVLDDLINTEAVPRVHLTKIFRQAAKSMIIQNSRRLNRGELPYLKKEEAEKALSMEMLNDFFWFTLGSPERTLEMTVDLATSRIPRTFGFDPMKDIMVLAPMRKGKVGLEALNAAMEAKLNPGPDGEPKKPIVPLRGICVGSRIVQTVNLYHPDGFEKSVMNGEVGIVLDYRDSTKEALLSFDDGEREFWLPVSDMDSFFLAWAITVHRSQGSQWPCVVCPVSTSHYAMLSRNLEYVAVTRSEKMCVMVGEKKALQIAVNNVDMQKRNSTLVMRIMDPAMSGELF